MPAATAAATDPSTGGSAAPSASNDPAPTEPASKTKAPATPEPPSAGGRGGKAILSAAAKADFTRLQSQLGGTIGIAVSGLGYDQPVYEAGSLRSAIAWSTSKVPVAMAIYDAGLSGPQEANLRAAITVSDNAAAMNLWNALGGGQQAAAAADQQLRAAGDNQTQVQSQTLIGGLTPFGQTVWSLGNQARFTAGMACTDSGDQVLGLMNEVDASQRWGLGSAGVPFQLKGGWGPGSSPGKSGGYLDRQMGVLTVRGKPMAITIAALPSDGSHETATRNLTAIAQWAVKHANVSKLPSQPRCS